MTILPKDYMFTTLADVDSGALHDAMITYRYESKLRWLTPILTGIISCGSRRLRFSQ